MCSQTKKDLSFLGCVYTMMGRFSQIPISVLQGFRGGRGGPRGGSPRGGGGGARGGGFKRSFQGGNEGDNKKPRSLMDQGGWGSGGAAGGEFYQDQW